MNELATLISRFFKRLRRRAESPEEVSVTRHAKLGDMIAQYTLAFMYETGRGAPQSNSEAKKWYLKAAEQGHMGAKQKLKKFEKD
jgi:hypothetical protein